MEPPLRLRRPSPIEKFETYITFVSWPVVWVLPYGWWTWAILYTPDVLLWLYRRAWDAQHPTTVTARRDGTSIVLTDAEGRERERFAPDEVDSFTSMLARNGVTKILRVERRSAPPLLFTLHTGEDIDDAASQLGLDLATGKSRYATSSLAARRVIFNLTTIVCLVWLFVFSPPPEIATWLVRYLVFIGMPFAVLMAIPTMVDVGRDGVAWRWLFVRRYVPYRSLVTLEPYPENTTRDRLVAVKLTTTSGEAHILMFPRHSSILADRIESGLAAYKSSAATETPPVEAWLPRSEDEAVDAWVRRLRAAAMPGGAYRTVSMDHLWATVEDSAATAEKRCAALLVLCTGDSARERALQIARTIIDPKLREAFEAIAKDSTPEQIAKLIETIG